MGVRAVVAVGMAAVCERRVAAGGGGELLGERGAQVRERGLHPVELAGIEAGHRRREDVAADELRLVDEVDPGDGEADEDHAAVVGDARALDEAPLLHAVDDPGGVRHRGVEDLGQAAHGHRLVVAEQRQHVEMGHADAELHEPLRPGTPERARGSADVGDDRLEGAHTRR